MTYGLTPEGFSIKTLPVIDSEIDTALKAVFGAQINTTPQSIFGQLKGIFAEREALLWELLQDLYQSQYPGQAGGVSLDHAVSLTAHTRLPAMASRINNATLAGTNGTVVPQGTLFAVDGNPDIQFRTETEVTIGAGGTVSADVIATVTGPIAADVNTLTEIVTPISGLASVTNPEAAIMGSDIETDAELKIRRNINLQVSNTGPTEAIRKAILELNEDTTKAPIEMVSVFENNTMATDSRGLPPKSFEAVVYQANGVTDRDDEIAETIMLRAKPAGIEPHGDVTVNVIDSQGFTHACKFSRPVMVSIYLELDLTTDSDYPNDGDNFIIDKIVEWGNALGAGKDVIVFPELVAQLAGIPGITDVVVRIGKSASPTTDDNVAIDNGSGGTVEMATFDAANITVTS